MELKISSKNQLKPTLSVVYTSTLPPNLVLLHLYFIFTVNMYYYGLMLNIHIYLLRNINIT